VTETKHVLAHPASMAPAFSFQRKANAAANDKMAKKKHYFDKGIFCLNI
jgi:hypothetical protein